MFVLLKVRPRVFEAGSFIGGGVIAAVDKTLESCENVIRDDADCHPSAISRPSLTQHDTLTTYSRKLDESSERRSALH